MLRHPYHLVDVSPWPILMSLTLLNFAFIIVKWLTHKEVGLEVAVIVAAIILISYQWFRDIVREAQGGFHTKRVQKGILISFLIFLSTEIMLFFSFFWAFFHSSLAPNVELGAVWPPYGIDIINPEALPLFGTTLLLSSGFILTWGHHALIKGDKYNALAGISLSFILGLAFAYGQYIEYCNAGFTIADSVYGSVFYMTTGLHFLHVIAGCLFLIFSTIRLWRDNVTSEHHIGLEFAIYYWHLVDVVWLFVYVFYYWWGS